MAWAGVSAMAAIDAAVEDQPATDAGRDGQVDEVANRPGPAGAVPPLRDRAGGGVVVHDRRPVERLGDHRDERDPVPAGQPGRRLNDPGIRVERAAAGDADGRNRRPRDAGPLDGLPSQVDQPTDELPPPEPREPTRGYGPWQPLQPRVVPRPRSRTPWIVTALVLIDHLLRSRASRLS